MVLQLPDPYYSINGWIAQVDKDSVLINRTDRGKGKFLVVGWSPLGTRCVLNQAFEAPDQAQEWIESLDPLTRFVSYKQVSARVFVAFDGNYWWSTPAYPNNKERPSYCRLFVIKDMEHAAAMVLNTLRRLSHRNSN